MPKIVDKEQRRQEIAMAALNLFAEEGFTVPVSRIAEVVGLSKGSLYVYFDSREELILAALTQWTFGLLNGSSEMLRDTDDAGERFRQYCHSATENFIKDPRSVKIVVAMMHLWLTKSHLFSGEDIFARYVEFFRGEAMQIINTGVASGLFNPEIARISHKMVINLFAFLDGLVLHYWMNPNFDVREQIDLYVDQMLHMLTSAENREEKACEKNSSPA
jgi:AcrR family transcriptional regulator